MRASMMILMLGASAVSLLGQATAAAREGTVSLAGMQTELTRLKRDLAELRVGFYQYRVAGLEQERKTMTAELKHLQEEEGKFREQVESFDRQLASAPFSGEERAQADEARAELGGRALGEIRSRQSALAARLNECEQRLRQERLRLDEALAQIQQGAGAAPTPVEPILLTK